MLRKGAVLKSLCPHILIAKSCLSPLQSTNSLSPNSATAELYRKIWHPCYPWIGKSYRTCLEGVQGLNLSPNVMLMWVCVTHHLSSFMFCEVSPISYDFNCHMDRLICFLSIAKIHKLDWVCNRPEEFHPQFSKIYLTSETSIRTLIKTTTPLKWLSLLILPKIFDFKDYSHFFYLLKIWIKLVNSSTYYLYGLSDRMFTGNSGCLLEIQVYLAECLLEIQLWQLSKPNTILWSFSHLIPFQVLHGLFDFFFSIATIHKLDCLCNRLMKWAISTNF